MSDDIYDPYPSRSRRLREQRAAKEVTAQKAKDPTRTDGGSRLRVSITVAYVIDRDPGGMGSSEETGRARRGPATQRDCLDETVEEEVSAKEQDRKAPKHVGTGDVCTSLDFLRDLARNFRNGAFQGEYPNTQARLDEAGDRLRDVTTDRDAARAEVEKLRAELAEARDDEQRKIANHIASISPYLLSVADEEIISGAYRNLDAGADQRLRKAREE
jgi:hypothetical protein